MFLLQCIITCAKGPSSFSLFSKPFESFLTSHSFFNLAKTFLLICILFHYIDNYYLHPLLYYSIHHILLYNSFRIPLFFIILYHVLYSIYSSPFFYITQSYHTLPCSSLLHSSSSFWFITFNHTILQLQPSYRYDGLGGGGGISKVQDPRDVIRLSGMLHHTCNWIEI